jgi:hypothetical protein
MIKTGKETEVKGKMKYRPYRSHQPSALILTLSVIAVLIAMFVVPRLFPPIPSAYRVDCDAQYCYEVDPFGNQTGRFYVRSDR